ncbi:MAG: response regulator [Hydrogenophaga sp.]|nr:response regulator [Hydrogenophaga sp.]
MTSERSLHLLVADDDPIQLRAAARLLKLLGHTGALANNGRTALNLLERQSFDAVMLDLRMPELDGLETLSRMRNGRHQQPVALISGDDLGSDWNFYRQAGADAYLVKPLELSDLRSLLQRWQ